MTGVFISYRRDDVAAATITGRLYERLVRVLGREAVFKDVFSIDLGRDFGEVIADWMTRATILLVLMGDRWDAERLNLPEDPVRKEIELALALRIRVIPVFVRDSHMTPAAALPPSLQAFARLNGTRLRDDPDFDNDISRLLRSLKLTHRRPQWLRLLVAMAATAGTIALVFATMHFYRNARELEMLRLAEDQALAIDGVFIRHESTQIIVDNTRFNIPRARTFLDVRLRNRGPATVNVTQAELEIIKRIELPYTNSMHLYCSSANYEIEPGERISVAHVLHPGEVDRFTLTVGTANWCAWSVRLVLTYNGTLSVSSEPLSLVF